MNVQRSMYSSNDFQIGNACMESNPVINTLMYVYVSELNASLGAQYTKLMEHNEMKMLFPHSLIIIIFGRMLDMVSSSELHRVNRSSVTNKNTIK